MKKRKLFDVCLCLFDGGAAGGAVAAGGAGPAAGDGTSAGVTPSAAGKERAGDTVLYGKQPEAVLDNPQAAVGEKPTATTTSDTLETKKAEFDRLIKGDYKELFDARVQAIISRRFAETKNLQERMDKLSPLMDMLAAKYGVDGNDIDAVTKAINEDKGFYEQAALEKGLTVDVYKHMLEVEAENKRLKAVREEAERRNKAQQVYSQWMQEADTVKQLYPAFDFDTEMQNPQFGRLLQSGVGVKAAYQAIHMDDIVGGAMQYTAQTVAKKQADAIRAKSSRPMENGLAGQGGVVVKNDVSKLTAADRREIARRAVRGETISF